MGHCMDHVLFSFLVLVETSSVNADDDECVRK